MANTYTLISSSTVGSGGAANFDFTSIPSTYTDLVLLTSLRCSNTSSNGVYVDYNGSTSSYSVRYVLGDGSSASSGTISRIVQRMVDSNGTANTFANSCTYIPNYTSSNYKSSSTDTVAESNVTSVLMNLDADLWSDTAAINQITVTPASGGNLAQYSTAYLYGISNS